MQLRSCAAIYRSIESTQGVFKYNGIRLTLRDPKSRPFASMGRAETDEFLMSMVERIGLEVRRVVPPGSSESRSSKFSTFIVAHPGDVKEFPIVFGYAYSAAEEIQVTELSREIDRISSMGHAPRIWNGAEYVQVNGVIRRGGSYEKADAVLLMDGSPVMSLSLKNLRGGKASQMQGWSGLVGQAGRREVIDFVDAVRDSGMSRAWRRIQDMGLRSWACWGSGSDSVDMIVAGSGIRLVDDGAGHRISLHSHGGIWHAANDEIPSGDFEPVLFCRPSCEHSVMTSTGRIRGIRAMIAPLAVASRGKSSSEV